MEIKHLTFSHNKIHSDRKAAKTPYIWNTTHRTAKLLIFKLFHISDRHSKDNQHNWNIYILSQLLCDLVLLFYSCCGQQRYVSAVQGYESNGVRSGNRGDHEVGTPQTFQFSKQIFRPSRILTVSLIAHYNKSWLWTSLLKAIYLCPAIMKEKRYNVSKESMEKERGNNRATDKTTWWGTS